MKAKLKATTSEFNVCMEMLREKESMLSEQTKLRAELETSNVKMSNSLASMKTKTDKLKHELDEKSKQASPVVPWVITRIECRVSG